MRVGLVVVVCGLFGLAGCAGGVVGGMNEAGGSQAPGVAGARLTGAVHGGQNPVSGAHVYLFAAASGASGAGQAAYGGNGIAASVSNASVSLLTKGSGQDGSGNYYVTTGGDGSFSVSGDYTCVLGQQVYLYSLGGDPGLGTGGNPAAGLMAVLGNCPGAGTFPSGMYVVVNEVSTVAAAYAMAGFATDATHVGSSGTALALTGIANAFANAANLETLGTGGALAVTPAGNGTVPQAEINTLANILASCVNSNGVGTACGRLFEYATSGGTCCAGIAPTDTATAAINIAHYPGNGMAASLWSLASGTPAFANGLTAQPGDFTIALSFTGGGLSSPYGINGIAIDSSGNAWVTNSTGNSVTEFSSSGAPVSGTPYTGGGLNNCYGIAIDRSGNVWVANDPAGTPATGGNSITELSSSGPFVSGSPYMGGGLNRPYSLAIDGSGNVWVTNSGNDSVTEISAGGTFLSGTNGYTGGGLALIEGIAIDGKGASWVANRSAGSVEISSTGAFLSGASGFYAGGGPFGVAIDATGNAWVTGTVGGTYTEIPNSGSNGTTFLGSAGGVFGVAVDGAGNVWMAGNTGNRIAEYSHFLPSQLSGRSGYTGGGLNGPLYLAVDGSGDVWVSTFSNAVIEFLGVGTPVITPIAAGLPVTPTADGSSNLGTRP